METKNQKEGGRRTVLLPEAPVTGSPAPWLTSLYAGQRERGNYGDSRYPGNCDGGIIKDLLLFFKPKTVFDPMEGSGTCKDVCRELDINCYSTDLKRGSDAADPNAYPRTTFDFVWMHPPYWRQKVYSDNPLDLSTTRTLPEFIDRYGKVIENCRDVLAENGHMAILMGDYSDRDEGFVPLVFYTKYLCMKHGMRQSCTDIIRFSHGASSSKKKYTSSFIPGLHDVVTIVKHDWKKGRNAA